MKNRPLRIGDLCITVNTDHPGVNEGILVTIHRIDPTQRGRNGEPAPYLIRRIDGLPHGSTYDKKTGGSRWYRYYDAWCAGRKLKRINPDAPGPGGIVSKPVEVPAECS